MPNTTTPENETETLQGLLNAVMNAERKYARLGAKADKAMAKANACMCLQAPAVAPAVPRGVAGDRCGPGNECGRLGCEECQQ